MFFKIAAQTAEESPAAGPPGARPNESDWFDGAPGPAGHAEVTLFAALMTQPHIEFEEWAENVLAGREIIATSKDLGNALSVRGYSTLRLVSLFMAQYPGVGRLVGSIPSYATLLHYLDRENPAKTPKDRRALNGPYNGRQHQRRSMHAKRSIALLLKSDGRKMANWMIAHATLELER